MEQTERPCTDARGFPPSELELVPESTLAVVASPCRMRNESKLDVPQLTGVGGGKEIGSSNNDQTLDSCADRGKPDETAVLDLEAHADSIASSNFSPVQQPAISCEAPEFLQKQVPWNHTNTAAASARNLTAMQSREGCVRSYDNNLGRSVECPRKVSQPVPTNGVAAGRLPSRPVEISLPSDQDVPSLMASLLRRKQQAISLRHSNAARNASAPTESTIVAMPEPRSKSAWSSSNTFNDCSHSGFGSNDPGRSIECSPTEPVQNTHHHGSYSHANGFSSGPPKKRRYHLGQSPAYHVAVPSEGDLDAVIALKQTQPVESHSKKQTRPQKRRKACVPRRNNPRVGGAQFVDVAGRPVTSVSEAASAAADSRHRTAAAASMSEAALATIADLSASALADAVATATAAAVSLTPSVFSAPPAADDLLWNRRFCQVRDYKVQNGGCDVIPSNATGDEEVALRRWTAWQRYQRRLLRKGRPTVLTPERLFKLDGIDFDWAASTASKERLEKERASVAARRMKASQPSSARASTDHDNDSRREPWTRRLAELRKYFEENRNSSVPRYGSNFPGLNNWLSSQRRSFAALKRGENSPMDDAMVTELNEIDPQWHLTRTELRREELAVAEEAEWVHKIEALRKFQKCHGSLSLPCPSEDGGLSRWAKKIRAQRRLFDRASVVVGKEDSPTFLSSSRIKQLDELGFVWVAQRGVTWEERLVQLASFKTQYGHLMVPKGYKGLNSLAQWAARQRDRYRFRVKESEPPSQVASGVMTDAELDSLEKVGFQWEEPSPKEKKEYATSPTMETCQVHNACCKGLKEHRECCRIGAGEGGGKSTEQESSHSKISMQGTAQKVFQFVVWSKLVSMGWTVELGGKRCDGSREDKYYCLPGAHYGRPYRKGFDFFNSTTKVLEFLRADSEWSRPDHAGQLITLFDTCLKVKEELADKGMLPKDSSCELLRKIAMKRLNSGAAINCVWNEGNNTSQSNADKPSGVVTLNGVNYSAERDGSKVENLEAADDSLLRVSEVTLTGSQGSSRTRETQECSSSEQSKQCKGSPADTSVHKWGTKKKQKALTQCLGRQRLERVLFQRVVWPKLNDLGWHIEIGARKTDNYFCMPGKHRGKPFKNRVDYFDSIRQVINVLQHNDEWSKREEVIKVLTDLCRCRQSASRLDAEGELPTEWTIDWLLHKAQKQHETVVIGGELLPPTRKQFVAPVSGRSSELSSSVQAGIPQTVPIQHQESTDSLTGTKILEAEIVPGSLEMNGASYIQPKPVPRSFPLMSAPEDTNTKSISTPQHRSRDSLFVNTIFPVLKNFGWSIAPGRDKSDIFYCKPGTRWTWMPFRMHLDYFDSIESVMHHLETDITLSGDGEVRRLIRLFRASKQVSSDLANHVSSTTKVWL